MADEPDIFFAGSDYTQKGPVTADELHAEWRRGEVLRWDMRKTRSQGGARRLAFLQWSRARFSP